MNVLRNYFLLLFALMLLAAMASCGTIGLPFPAAPDLTTKSGVQKVINEVNVDITAAANVIKTNVTEGFITPDEAQKQLDRTKDYRKRADQAQAFLDTGNIGDARVRAELAQSLIKTLRLELAKRAKEPK